MADLSYRASLKDPHVEELVDLALHRPLGYVLARGVFATGVSPDALTLASMLVGILAAAALAAPCLGLGRHNVLGALLLIASAVLDCSDGQLARMRRHASRHGRMLDGAVDTMVQLAVVPSVVAAMVYRRGGLLSPGTLAWTAATVLGVWVGVYHTTLYDQFKNVYVRNTDPNPGDCDDLQDVESEWQRLRAAGPVGLLTRAYFTLYRLHLELAIRSLRQIDPRVPSRFSAMPSYTPSGAARYRALNNSLMRAWSFYGVGTHIFALAFCCIADRLEWYVVFRVGVLNVALLALVPAQRRASRTFFRGGESAEVSPPSPARV